MQRRLWSSEIVPYKEIQELRLVLRSTINWAKDNHNLLLLLKKGSLLTTRDPKKVFVKCLSPQHDRDSLCRGANFLQSPFSPSTCDLNVNKCIKTDLMPYVGIVSSHCYLFTIILLLTLE